MFRRELAPEDGLRGWIGDGGKLCVEFGGLGGVAERGHAGGQRGAGGGDDAGHLGLDAGVEIGLRRLESGDAGLKGGGFSLGTVAFGAEGFEVGSEQSNFAAQRIKMGGGLGQQVGLGIEIPLEGINLGAGFG